jgi:hypothetical protein
MLKTMPCTEAEVHVTHILTLNEWLGRFSMFNSVTTVQTRRRQTQLVVGGISNLLASSYKYFNLITNIHGHMVAYLIEALRYKSEGRTFHSK